MKNRMGTQISRGELLWDRAGAMGVLDAVQQFGGIQKAAMAAAELLGCEDEVEAIIAYLEREIERLRGM